MPSDLIFGHTWEEIQAMQRGEQRRAIDTGQSSLSFATRMDIELLRDKGLDWLENQSFFGVIDRLQNSGIIPRQNPARRNPTMDKVAASELEIYISNSRELMLRRLPEFIKNVARKMKRGTYDPVKSVKLWRYLVDEAAKMYAKEYGGKWNEMFTVPTRNAVAMELERDYAAQIRDGNWSGVLDAAKIKLNPSPRGSGVRIVHNKLLGGWYIVRGPHQTPISGRYNTKAEAQAWLNRNKANPAARKKKVTAKKKTAAKKKPTARKKIAVNAKSRATGKPPSARLKKRRARNTVPGAYPNPAKRKVTSKTKGFAIWAWDGINPYVFTGTSLSATRGLMPEIFPSERAAKEVLRMFVIPNFKRSFAPGSKPWAFTIRPANTRFPDAARWFREQGGIVPGKM